VGLFVLLILFGSAVALLLVLESKRISSAGGWGFAVGAFFVCVAGGVCGALSLWRGEAHRRLSIALLVVSALVVWTFRRVPGGLVQLLLPHQ